MAISRIILDSVPAERLSDSADCVAAHSYDAWPIAVKWRQQGKQPCKPDLVAHPHSTQEVAALLRECNENGNAVTPWGLGSSVVGSPLTEAGGVVIDLSRMDRIIALDEDNLLVTVQAGKRGDLLEAELNERGYTLNHSPQSLDRSTVGGWVATRATGQLSSLYGGIEDQLIALEVVLPDGRIVQTKQTPRAAIGLDTKEVFLGSEGTFGIVTQVTTRIFPLKSYRRLETVTFDTVSDGIKAMRAMTRNGLKPFIVRFYDVDEARHAMKDPSFGQCVMFLGFEGIEAVVEAEYAAVMDLCRAHGGKAIGPAGIEGWLARRYDFSAVENILARPGGVAETIEISDFWSSIEGTYEALKTALAPLADEVLCHFSHVYAQGSSLYVILIGQAEDAAAAEARIRRIWEVAMRICLERGAATSHHHGVGLARKDFVAADQGDAMVVNQLIKSALDPNNIMNPGKLGYRPRTPAETRN
ncbi:FAD-binding oxidoreductase [Paracoccus marinaquae]|uniref:FAD-binding oxidoreductase n=1 Tax=Paracoccus marinaquae TaxID=2841926 RepID=A0ABS6AM43_9RHOB|nr:FAD-binding oxidoreductase [Paracoccus marinaquae]